ncbi:putative pyridoxal-dependent decarboxylase domain-containing protein 2 isoform X1 [Mytilus edulis]|uniref:putative pyridoxal-dependent decarboxylase domain-containing protein 2 isoform X1 n=1 Tax=Mytilus edulis TaxID=6550 RepID=UPI0039F0CE3C
MAEASSARPLVEPKQVEEKSMEDEPVLEMNRYVEEEKSKKKVSFTETIMPFDKPEFKPGANEMGASEEMFQQMFMDPMMKDLNRHVQANTDILDKISKDMEDQRKQRLKDRQTSHIPEALKGGGQEMKEIMNKVEDLILFGNAEEVQEEGTVAVKVEKSSAKLQELDSHARAALTAHSLSAYVSTLDEAHLKTFTTKIVSDCELWLSRLFRFGDSSVVYHEEEMDGLVKICRLAMYQKYPKYPTEGFEALYSRPPVIYVSASAKPGVTNYLCLQLGLPLSCICTVPVVTRNGAVGRMNIDVLENLIRDDIAAAKTPVMLVCFAGTPLTGQVDNLDELQDICKRKSIWLHVEGNTLATLTMFSVPTSLQNAKCGDSMTLAIGRWLGIPGLPYCTLYKTNDPALVIAAGLNTFNSQLKLNCLPLWICLQSFGHDGIVDRVKSSCDLAEALYKGINDMPTIKQYSIEKKEEEDVKGIKDLIFKAISALVVFEIVTPNIVFQYAEDGEQTGIQIAPYSTNVEEEEEPEEDQNAVYYDALNMWLGETMQMECPKLNFQIVKLEKEGICLRFAPLECAQVKGIKPEDVEESIVKLKDQINILDATVGQRDKFRACVDQQKNLKLIEMPKWAGLGVVQYLPESCVNHSDHLSHKPRHEINTVNIELVKKLKATDTAFSLGRLENELACVKFGLITDDTDVEELIDHVMKCGKEIEESSRYFEALADLIKQGITIANEDLKKESEEKLQQEGVLRQVPLVGSLLNWWSPPPKDQIKGRTFNLKSGTMASTETTYKYHMQVQEETHSKEKDKKAKTNLFQKGDSQTEPTSPSTKTAQEIRSELQHESTSPTSKTPPEKAPTDIPGSPSTAESPVMTEAPGSPQVKDEGTDLK